MGQFAGDCGETIEARRPKALLHRTGKAVSVMRLDTPFWTRPGSGQASTVSVTGFGFGNEKWDGAREPEVARQIEDFFAGSRDFDSPLAPEGSDFQQRLGQNWSEFRL